MSAPVLRRVARRETHSPRTTAMFIAVLIVIAALVYVAVEIVLFLASQPALLIGPGAGVSWIVSLPSAGGPAAAGAVVLAVVGLIFMILAVTPGRLPRQEIAWGDRAVVVDNGVVAASLAQFVSEETGLARDAVLVGVGHRAIDVTVRPGWGMPLDRKDVVDVVEAEVESYRLARRVKIRVRVERPDQKDVSR